MADYMIKYLNDKKNNEILIQKRLYSALKKALRQISFAYYGIISDKISSLMRNIYRKLLVRLFAEIKKKLKFVRI